MVATHIHLDPGGNGDALDDGIDTDNLLHVAKELFFGHPPFLIIRFLFCFAT